MEYANADPAFATKTAVFTLQLSYIEFGSDDLP